MMRRILLLTVVLVANSKINAVASDLVDDQKEPTVIPCSVCSTGSVRLPNKVVSVPGVFEELTCEQLDTFLPLLYPDSTDLACQNIQSIGAICGCPTPDNACSVCKDNAPMTFPNRPLNFFSDMFGGITPDCEIVAAYVRTSYTEDDSSCTMAQSLLAEYCECLGTISDESNSVAPPCSLCEDGSPITLPDEELNIEGFPFTNCRQIDEAVSALYKTGSEQCTMFQSVSSLCGCPRKENSCSMCSDGSSIDFPDKPARFLKGIFGSTAPSCKVYEAYAHSLDSGSEDCDLIQVSSGFCGCPSVENHCQVCDDGDELKPEFAEVEIDPGLLAFIGVVVVRFPVTCELVIGMENQVGEGEALCRAMRARRDVCGCNDGVFVYADAENEKKQSVLAWLPALSGGLSLLGALVIILDVVSDKKKRRQIYNQLMAAMSVFDVLSSIAYIVSTAANPTDDLWPVYGERGNNATCMTQAFFLQLGVTSVVYSVSLTTYYYMSVVLGWRGDRLKSQVNILHAVPLVLGISMAFAGIPFYGSVMTFCYIPSPPLHDSWVPITWLQIIPILAAIAISTILIFLVWLKVHRQVENSSRWRFSPDAPRPKTEERTRRPFLCLNSSDKSTLTTIQRVERSVMWQALIYVAIFCISWISNIILVRKDEVSFEFYCIVAFLIPLHPFLNALNYFRPRIQRCCRQYPARCCRSERTRESAHPEPPILRHYTVSSLSSSSVQYSNFMSRQGGNENERSETSDQDPCHDIDEFDAILEPSAYLEGDDQGSEGTSSSSEVDDVTQSETGTPRSLTPTVMACIAEESTDEIEDEL